MISEYEIILVANNAIIDDILIFWLWKAINLVKNFKEDIGILTYTSGQWKNVILVVVLMVYLYKCYRLELPTQSCHLYNLKIKENKCLYFWKLWRDLRIFWVGYLLYI